MKSGENTKNDGNESSFGFVIYIRMTSVSVQNQQRKQLTQERDKSERTHDKTQLYECCVFRHTYHKVFFLGMFRFWEEMRTNAFACHRYCLPMKVGKTLWFPITFSMCNILLTISITIRCVLVWVFESVPNTHSRNISNNELFKHGQNCVKGVDFSHFHSIEFAHKHILRASTWRFARKWRLTSN